MAQTQTKTQNKQAPAAREQSISERFVGMVMQEFQSAFGNGMQLTPYQKKLAQHLYLRIDHALQEAEKKRIKAKDKERKPYIWQNVNLSKLAMDSVHRINLGLDGLIENHISPTAFWNSKEEKYDINLMVGYVGKDYYRRNMAIEKPVDVIYELVYSTDKFKPIKKNAKNKVEDYEFDIKDPWKRGEVVGGFGYIIYDEPEKNKLVLVTDKDFKRSESCSKSSFWKDNPIQMRYKTIVHRTTEKIPVDPEKINESYMIVEQDDMEETILGQIEEKTSKRETLDIKPDSDQEQETTEQPQEKPQSEPETQEEKRAPQQQTLPQEEKGPGF